MSVETNPIQRRVIATLDMEHTSGPTTIRYRKRAWRSDAPAGYVEWETTDPNAAYPGGGTLDPPLGVVLFKWTA